MALRFMDSFDHYTTDHLRDKWSSVSGSAVIAASGQLNNCLVLKSASVIKTLDYRTTYGVGFHLKLDNIGDSTDLLYLQDSGSGQCGVRLDASGTLSIVSGSSTLSTTGQSLVSGTWYFVEFIALINLAGSAKIRVNGATWSNVSDVSTVVTNNACANRIALLNSTSNSFYIDNLYILDNSGSKDTNLLGEIKVEVLRPAGAGASTSWTPVGGANYECVDDVTPDDEATYVFASTCGLSDLYTLSSLSSTTGNVLGIQVVSRAAYLKGTATYFRNIIMSGSTILEGASAAATSAYAYSWIDIWDSNVDTGSNWTIGTVGSAQVGVRAYA